MFGFFMHIVYVIVLNIYVAEAYQKVNTPTGAVLYNILLIIGIFYPWLYDFIQLCRGGVMDYLSDPWNYADMVYIYGSILNCILQFILGPFHIACRIIMCIIVILLVVKTFFFMRIFE